MTFQILSTISSEQTLSNTHAKEQMETSFTPLCYINFMPRDIILSIENFLDIRSSLNLFSTCKTMKGHRDHIAEKIKTYRSAVSMSDFMRYAISRREYQNVALGVNILVEELRLDIRLKPEKYRLSNGIYEEKNKSIMNLIASTGDLIAYKTAEETFMKLYGESYYNKVFDIPFYQTCVPSCIVGRNMDLIKYVISRAGGTFNSNYSMQIASERGDLEIAKLCLENGATNYINCAIDASRKGHTHIRDFFIEKMFENETMQYIVCHYEVACNQADVGTMEELFKRIPNDYRDRNYLLRIALRGLILCHATPEQFEFAIRHGASQRMLEGALENAIKTRNKDLALFLVKKGIQIGPEFTNAYIKLMTEDRYAYDLSRLS